MLHAVVRIALGAIGVRCIVRIGRRRRAQTRAARVRAMIIQRVIKGIGRISEDDARNILSVGIVCNWRRKVGTLPRHQVPLRLTDRNLDWHQNHYDDPDPSEGGEVFGRHTAFISTTAGTVEGDVFSLTNILNPAWREALNFATSGLRKDGYLFYCYLFIIGRQAVTLESFSKELRELNVYPGFSPYQPEGEITAKIIIPPAQIERAEFWSASDALRAVANRRLPAADPSRTLVNPLFVRPEIYNNVRDFLS